MSPEKHFFRFPEALDPSEYIFATYYVETPMDPHEAADAIAAEQSTGTWTRAKYETDERREKYGCKVVGVYKVPFEPGSYHILARMDWLDRVGDEGKPLKINAAVFRIAFPWANFGPLLANMLTAVGGNLFDMDALAAIKLIDLEFPESFTKQFRGPQFGIEGCRKFLGVYDRPLIGSIIKPCVGLSADEIADLAYQGAKGGLDFIKDDELIADTVYNSIKDRTKTICAALKRAEGETGKKTLYAFNITDRPSRIRELYNIVIDSGGNCVMLNAATIGWEVLRELAEFTEVPVYAHRDFAGAYLRSQYLGISSEVLTKIWRLAGADMLHVGPIQGKLFETDEEVLVNARVCLEDFHNIAKAIPVSAGGQWAGKLPVNCQKFGHTDFMHLSGGGVFAHPQGAEAGARSIHQAWEAYSQGISLEEYARDHSALQEAMAYFGSKS